MRKIKTAKRSLIVIFLGPLFLLICLSDLSGQSKGVVYGQVIDESTGELLPFTTVTLDGTTEGTIADAYGKYYLSNLPTGQVTLVFSFIGFQSISKTVDVKVKEQVELNVSIALDLTTLDEVVVTSQALGQAAAINQQINANTIVNVVSQDKIRELPDQNAAETVGRLPGISVQRDNGEAQKIVVRGLSPQFNSVTVNGERIPSTDNDRSVDLSMMSPDILAGIEVYKSLTPDRDADAIGGTVNFLTKRASEGMEGQITGQFGYNQLANEWGQYRGSFSTGKRFLDNKLGFLLGGNYQKANRNNDGLRNNVEDGEIIGGDSRERALIP
ncbi:MAG: carboxypeptidase-like regulatory domain-containing protein, partial [Bacteroidota bacterium]